ncbi:hypothetical protein EWM64_g3777 [Hericium alpestre]|uniref:Uncharacterized protein n=1 Tax=Hericium alpestre TaxID=135208 RepID=A0A4Z0A1Q7_9AGAM|nr:hypothetical protein EWM64_g3777 [Hericium alpestre]
MRRQKHGALRNIKPVVFVIVLLVFDVYRGDGMAAVFIGAKERPGLSGEIGKPPRKRLALKNEE